MAMTTDLGREMAVAREAARLAGTYLVERLGNAHAQGDKAARDALREVDRGAEQLLIEAIHAAFPEDAILWEEGDLAESSADRCWLIDPLDSATTSRTVGRTLLQPSP
jgi:myo-inositol-1(or 4)-monophosphatase